MKDKKTVGYKTLMKGFGLYVLCGLIWGYLMSVCRIFADWEAERKNINSYDTGFFDFGLDMALFFIVGGLTFAFWLVFMLCNRKYNFLKIRTAIVALAAFIVDYLYGTFSIGVHDNFIPYYNDTLDVKLSAFIELLSEPAFIIANLVSFLIALGIYYCIAVGNKKEPERDEQPEE